MKDNVMVKELIEKEMKEEMKNCRLQHIKWNDNVFEEVGGEEGGEEEIEYIKYDYQYSIRVINSLSSFEQECM